MNTQTITKVDYTEQEFPIVPGPEWVLVDLNISPRGKRPAHADPEKSGDLTYLRVLDSGSASIPTGFIAVVQKTDDLCAIGSRFDPLRFVRVDAIIALIDDSEPATDKPAEPDSNSTAGKHDEPDASTTAGKPD